MVHYYDYPCPECRTTSRIHDHGCTYEGASKPLEQTYVGIVSELLAQRITAESAADDESVTPGVERLTLRERVYAAHTHPTDADESHTTGARTGTQTQTDATETNGASSGTDDIQTAFADLTVDDMSAPTESQNEPAADAGADTDADTGTDTDTDPLTGTSSRDGWYTHTSSMTVDDCYGDCLDHLERVGRVTENADMGGLYLTQPDPESQSIVPTFDPLQTVFEYGPIDGCKDIAVFTFVSWCELQELSWEAAGAYMTWWLSDDATGRWASESWGESSIDELMRGKRHIYRKSMGWGDHPQVATSKMESSHCDRQLDAYAVTDTIDRGMFE
jgi:hypothetical protein